MKSFTAKQRMKNIDANAAVLSSARIDAICFHAENSGNALIGSEKRSSDQQYLSVANISWQTFQWTGRFEKTDQDTGDKQSIQNPGRH